jgi:transcriptional regulator
MRMRFSYGRAANGKPRKTLFLAALRVHITLLDREPRRYGRGMYVPAHFREDRSDVLHNAMRAIGFATLVTQTDAGIDANHLPLLLQDGNLIGHFARANPVWKTLKPGSEALAIFLGPHAYVSPSLYPSKAATCKAVPTWNYITVHARGRLTLHDDAGWLRAHVGALSDFHESERPAPWAVDDAPAAYIDSLLRAIVGFELSITALEGKWKLSQNRDSADRQGVQDGMRHEGHELLAALMQP